MSKRAAKFLVIMVLLLAAIWLFQRSSLLDAFGNIFRSQPVEIENTAIIVKEINALAQLVTITAYNEVVMDNVVKGPAIFNNPVIPTLLNIPNLTYADKKLVLIGKGHVLAGIELSELVPADVFIKEDSIALRLPPARILQVIINPTDFDTFEETGKWSDDEVRTVKIKLRDKLIANVLQQNILQQANDKAKLVMENFLTALGYKKTTITFAP